MFIPGTLNLRQIAPYTITVSGLPGGLVFQNGNVAGTPSAPGTYTVSVTAIDAVGASAAANLSLTIDPPSGNYTIPDESKGKISAIGAGYLMVGSKKLIWNSSTLIIVNTPNGELHVIDTFVKAGMKVQWKGLRDASTNTVLTSQLEVN
jgi:putative Ig domain-containing protein